MAREELVITDPSFYSLATPFPLLLFPLHPSLPHNFRTRRVDQLGPKKVVILSRLNVLTG